MTRFLFLLLSVLTLAASTASAQVRRGTGLLAHNHGPIMFYARTITLCVKAEDRVQFLQATSSLQAQSVRENGCLSYHYYEDPAAGNTFLLVSEWTTVATMEEYYHKQYVVDYYEQLSHWLKEPATVRIYETVKHQVATIQPKP